MRTSAFFLALSFTLDRPSFPRDSCLCSRCFGDSGSIAREAAPSAEASALGFHDGSTTCRRSSM